MTRLPLLPISFVLATASVGALVYQRTRPVQPEAVVQVDRVAEAVASTSSAKSFRFTYYATVSAAGQSLTMSGAGAYDLTRKLGAMSLQFESEAFGPTAGKVNMELVFDSSNGLVEYIHMPLLDSKLPPGKPWLKVDVGALSKQQGVDLSQAMQGDHADPAKFFAYLRRAADPAIVGHETVGGVETTHYRATVDLRRAAAAETDEATRETLQRAIKESGLTSFPMHVWIDETGYLRRMRFAIPFKAPDTDSGLGMITMSEELSDFGAPVNVAVPSPSSVVDVSALAGS